MKRLLILCVLAGLSGHAAFMAPASDYSRFGREDAAGIFRTYKPREAALTKAPKGYKPFYISHYGRHGSRYHAAGSYFAPALESLGKAEAAGLLSPTGEQLLGELRTLAAEHETLYGQLSPRGAEEHRGVANRMFRRFRRVFRARDRHIVHCESTMFPRCITSMANFATQLKGNNAKLDIEYFTGERYHNALLKEYDFGPYPASVEDSLRAAVCRHDTLFNNIFSDVAAAYAIIGDPQMFTKSLYYSGAICGCVDHLGVDLFKYFTDDELSRQASVANDLGYGKYGNSVETGDRIAPNAEGLLRDIITKADEALSDRSKVAANLRFGHDSGIMPLFSLIRIEGNDRRYNMVGAHDNWLACYYVPMCTNLQLIFYRNKKGSVLVKALYNEAEALFPALAPVSGPYYKWSDLREYFVSCLPGEENI